MRRQISELDKVREFRDEYIRSSGPLNVGDIVKIKSTNCLGYVRGFSVYGVFVSTGDIVTYNMRDGLELVERMG